MARARIESGEGRCGAVRREADIPVGIDGGRGEFAAFLTEADFPALLREGALGALGGQFDSPPNIPTLREQWVETPLILSCAGH